VRPEGKNKKNAREGLNGTPETNLLQRALEKTQVKKRGGEKTVGTAQEKKGENT